jgi:hypothetical protein
MQWFKFDDNKHLLYKWVASENHLAIIQNMGYSSGVVNSKFVTRDNDDYKTPAFIAGIEELERALDNREISCTYKY